MTNRLHICLVGPVPVDPNSPSGGVEAAITVQALELAKRENVEITLVRVSRARGSALTSSWNIPVIDASGPSWLPDSLRYLTSPFRTSRVIRAAAPDVAHYHAFPLAGVLTKSRRILTIHGFAMQDSSQRPGRLRWVRSQLLELAERFAVSTFDEHLLLSDVVSEVYGRQIHGATARIWNPVDPLFFSTTSKGPRRSILTVGAVSAPKNQRELIAALGEAAAKTETKCTLRIAGPTRDQEYEQACRSEATIWKKYLEVSFLGELTKTQLAQEYADALVLCSASRQEHLPLNVAEALASGTPVLATSAGATADLIGSCIGSAALATVELVAKQTIDLINDPDKLLESQAQARHRACVHFTARAVTDRCLDAYRQGVGSLGAFNES